LAVLVAILLGLAGNLVTGSVSLPVATSWIWSGTVVLVMAAAGLGVILARQPSLDGRRYQDLPAIASRLAAMVRAQYREVQHRERFQDSLLDVRWRQVTTAASGAAEPAPTGELFDIVRLYRAIPSGRLVVLGEPGAGKSVLAVVFALELLESRDDADPVPVVFSLDSWDSTRIPISDWLARQLVLNYPGLGSAGPAGETAAASLIERRYLLPILDGLDALPLELRQHAIQRINNSRLPFLLTSRDDAYVAAMTEGVTPTQATVVELLPLTAAAVAGYLAGTTAADTWDEVLAGLRSDPGGPLATALRTPLMANLFRVAYGEGPSAPSELLDPVRFADRTAIERHLLDAAIPAVLSAPSRPSDRPRWSTARMLRWLGFLARQLEQEGTRDIAWWRLDHAVPSPVFIAIGSVIAAVGGFAAGLAFDTAARGWVAPTVGSAAGLVLVSTFAWTSRSTPSPRTMEIQLRRIRGRVVLWLGLGGGAGLVGGYLLEGADSGGVAAWLAAGTAAGLVGALRETVGGPMDLHRAVGPVQVLMQDRANTLMHATITGLTAVLVVAVAGGLARTPVATAVFALTCALASASSTAYYRYLVSYGWLAVRGLLPWSFLRLLEEAHGRGVLRVVGAVYQFRHALLQTGLASEKDGGQLVGQPTDTAAEEAISALKDSLVATAFERADVQAVVDAPRIVALKREIRAEIDSSRTKIAGAAAAGRERFVAARARYVERVGVPALSRGAEAYAASATTALAFAGAGLIALARPFVGTIFLGLAGLLAGTGLCLSGLHWLASLKQARRARHAIRPARWQPAEPPEPDDPDEPRKPEERPDEAADAGLDEEATESGRPTVIRPERWLATSRAVRLVAVGCLAAAPGIVAVGLLESLDRNYLPPVNLALVAPAALGAMLLGLLWLWARPWRARYAALRSEDPTSWPPEDDVRRAASARQDAVRARAEWINALLENGVLPLVSAKVEVLAKRSYDTVLPAASVSKLGDITESVQFVPTETSAELGRMLAAMSNGAVGLSGPRGIGKSTMLRVFGDRRFGASPDDLTLVVPAPTNYNSRDFLVHLFTRLCELLLPGEAEARAITPRVKPYWARSRWLALAGLGVLLVVGGLTWPMLVRAGNWLQGNLRAVVVAVGIVLTCAAVACLVRGLPFGRRGRRSDNPAEDRARYYLRILRYQESRTSARSGMLKASIGLEVGGSTSRQRTEQIRTYPELVSDFRDFLDFLALRLRSRARGPAGRIVICIDELDKIATAEQAEQFINDIKTVFGVEGCFFLVAVSEDALTSFARRALAVRTTFDSAFDNVIQVRRFLLADTRRLLVQRVLRLPEPFVWLCHGLSGGLPRDINRTVRLMYDIRLVHRTDTFDRIAGELILRDVETVTQGQILRVSGRVNAESGAVLRWLAATRQLPLDSAQLLKHSREVPSMTAAPLAHDETNLIELRLLVDQFRIYLYYTAVLVRCFCEQSKAVIEALRHIDDDASSPVQHLADARVNLSVEPALARSAIDAFQSHLRSAGIPALDAADS
jgi:hypothetical protein